MLNGIKKPTGSSIIDHKIRHSLCLTIEEFVMADCIYIFNSKHKTGIIDYIKYHSEIGLTPEEVNRIGKSLKEKGMIIKNNNRWETTGLWNKHFDSTEQFEELWKIHPKGNKYDAKINFKQTIRIVKIDILIEKLQNYVGFCLESERFMSDLSGWLNPKKKHWEDPIEYKGKLLKEKNNGMVY